MCEGGMVIPVAFVIWSSPSATSVCFRGVPGLSVLLLFSGLYTILQRAGMHSCGSGLTSSILGLAHALPMTLDRSGRVLPHDKAEDTASLQAGPSHLWNHAFSSAPIGRSGKETSLRTTINILALTV